MLQFSVWPSEPSRLSATAFAQTIPTIRVGWTIPAEEAKYWMMKRPDKFPNLGKTYKIEWSQFNGTSPMTSAMQAGALDCATQGVLPIAQSMAAGNLDMYVIAQHVGEKPGSFSLYWAVKDDSPIKTAADLKGKTVGISVIGGGTHAPFNMMLRKNGVDPEKDIKLVEVGFALSEDALRSGRVDAVNMVQPFAARAEAKGGVRKLFALEEALPNIVHIVEACRKDFVEKNPELVTSYVKDLTLGMKMALANRPETIQVVHEVMKAPIPALDILSAQAERFRARARCGAELRRHPGDVRRLYRQQDDLEEARRLDAEASEDRRADGVTGFRVPERSAA